MGWIGHCILVWHKVTGFVDKFWIVYRNAQSHTWIKKLRSICLLVRIIGIFLSCIDFINWMCTVMSIRLFRVDLFSIQTVEECFSKDVSHVVTALGEPSTHFESTRRPFRVLNDVSPSGPFSAKCYLQSSVSNGSSNSIPKQVGSCLICSFTSYWPSLLQWS